ncbi:MAG: DUF4421 family protein [Bacteroidales bacterium]|nr:DUF4421 family protein [Bacteroidales bacterium]
MITGALILFLTSTFIESGAQNDTTASDSSLAPFDSNYLSGYTNLLTTRAFLLFQNASMLINPADEKISKIVYRPNVNLRIGIAGFWKWFGLGLSVVNPIYKTDRNVYGKTTTLDLRVNAFGRAIAGEMFLQRYKGYYIASPARQDGTHFIISDMRTFSLGLAGYWIYNAEKFSIRAAFIQNEGQKKSAGSLVVRPAFTYYRISSGHGIIPTEIADAYQIPAANLITGGKFYSLGLSPGYVYTLIFLKNIYITAALFPGVAAQFSSYTSEFNQYSDFEFAFQLNGRFALGYNSDKWFLGCSVHTGFKEVPDKLNNALFSYDVAQFRLWGGTRFAIFKTKKKKSGTRYNEN